MVLIIISQVILFEGCFREPARFVEGHEASDLLQKVHGYLVINQSWDSSEPEAPRILSLSFPNLEQTVIRRNINTVWALSGPDQEKRIAFVEYDRYASAGKYRHKLKVAHLDSKKEEQIFEHSGRPVYEDAIGKNLALSPVGGLIAFVGKLTKNQNPGALLTTGYLEIWNIKTKAGYNTGIIAVDERIWWSPDGEELAYVALVPRHDIPIGQTLPGSPYGDNYEKQYGRWNSYPGVFIYNTKTRERHLLHYGWKPVFSPDGKKALIFSGGRWLSIDIEKHRVQNFDYPASWSAPLSLLSNNMAIFIGYPMKGTKPRWLKRGSFKVGTQMKAIKVGEIGTWKFCTVLPYHDPRDEFSFGIKE